MKPKARISELSRLIMKAFENLGCPPDLVKRMGKKDETSALRVLVIVLREMHQASNLK